MKTVLIKKPFYNNISDFESSSSTSVNERSTNRPQTGISGQTEVVSAPQGSLKLQSDIVWFSTLQTANYLDISVQALMNMTSNGKIPYYKLGRRNRYKKSDLDHLLESNRKGPYNEY